MVLVTTPPQPASKAFKILRLLSVGGAEAKMNGFTNSSPVKVVASLLITAFLFVITVLNIRSWGKPGLRSQSKRSRFFKRFFFVTNLCCFFHPQSNYLPYVIFSFGGSNQADLKIYLIFLIWLSPVNFAASNASKTISITSSFV